MKDLSLTQQYLLCALKKDGKLPAFGVEKTVCLSAAGVLELLMDQVLAYDGKKLRAQAPLPETKEYLRPVYDVIVKKQPVKFQDVVEHFSLSFTDKALNELLEGLEESLVKMGCVRKEEKRGFLGGSTVYPPEAEAVDAVVQTIRGQLLEDRALSEETVALVALLNKSGDLQKYFSSYEKDTLRKRLREIKDNPQSVMVQQVVEYVDSLLLLLLVAST